MISFRGIDLRHGHAFERSQQKQWGDALSSDINRGLNLLQVNQGGEQSQVKIPITGLISHLRSILLFLIIIDNVQLFLYFFNSGFLLDKK
jgi:hypothetical protein